MNRIRAGRAARPDAPAPGLRHRRGRDQRRAGAGRGTEFAIAELRARQAARGRLPFPSGHGGQLRVVAADAVAGADDGQRAQPPVAGRRHAQPRRAAVPFPGAQLRAPAGRIGRQGGTEPAQDGVLPGRRRRDRGADLAGRRPAGAVRPDRARRAGRQLCRMPCAGAAARRRAARAGTSGRGAGWTGDQLRVAATRQHEGPGNALLATWSTSRSARYSRASASRA